MVKSKAIPVKVHRGPQGCETSRLPHFLDNRLTVIGEVVSLTSRPPCARRKIPGTHFCYRLSRSQGHCAAGTIRLNEKSNYHIGNRTRDLPACSIVPQPTTRPRAPHCIYKKIKAGAKTLLTMGLDGGEVISVPSKWAYAPGKWSQGIICAVG
jgi:hypothetical protein